MKQPPGRQKAANRSEKSQHPVLQQMRDNDGTDVGGHAEKGYVAQGSKPVTRGFSKMVRRYT